MSYASVPDGTYNGTIEDYGLMETKSGKIMAYAKVKFDFGGKQTRMTWFSGITSAVSPGKKQSQRDFVVSVFQKINSRFTFHSLLDRSENGSDTPEIVGSDVSVVVENERNPNTDETQSRIKYLNASGGKYKRVSVQVLSSLRSGQDLTHQPLSTQPFTEDDLPF